MDIKRAFLVILDGFGVGETPDSAAYGDPGAHTFANLKKEFEKRENRPLRIPHLYSLGLENLDNAPSKQIADRTKKLAFWGKANEVSQGKDTTSGHWEMMGFPVTKAFQTFPNGFSEPEILHWLKACNLPGVLGNKAASGTQIIDELGLEHIESGKPILYTSADSVWQVAAHEEYFGLKRLYDICYEARKICDRLNVSRVIARPFVGDPRKGIPFKRTYNRKDLSLVPNQKTWLNILQDFGIQPHGIGKISNIYAAQGISSNTDTHGNTDGLEKLILHLDNATAESQFVFCNLIDFDMVYGHRRDSIGFGHALEEFDVALGKIISKLKRNDLLMISADHGNDPTYRGTDHTREAIPVIGLLGQESNLALPVPIGIRQTFADLGATITDFLLGDRIQIHQLSPRPTGKSFLDLIIAN